MAVCACVCTCTCVPGMRMVAGMEFFDVSMYCVRLSVSNNQYMYVSNRKTFTHSYCKFVRITSDDNSCRSFYATDHAPTDTGRACRLPSFSSSCTRSLPTYPVWTHTHTHTHTLTTHTHTHTRSQHGLTVWTAGEASSRREARRRRPSRTQGSSHPS